MKIQDIHAVADGPISRVCANVNDKPLWFESADVSLRPAAEAFGCALLPAAVERGADLLLDGTIDTLWSENVQAVQDIWRQWWGFPGVRIRPGAKEVGTGIMAGGVALCFSGGVDSFFSLLCGGWAIDHLVFVHGYDMKLSDIRRAQAMERSLREVAQAVGVRAILVRTNLREHPTFAATDWEKAHGAALAAVGHLLTDVAGTIIISASYPRCFDRPWGSHWKTDPLWSSSWLKVVHGGADYWRADKLRALAGQELVRRHLRVCWENPSPEGNCGRCEKCIRTMLVLAQASQLRAFPVFDEAADLAERIHELPRIGPDLVRVYEQFARESPDPQTAAALWSLIARSRPKRKRGHSTFLHEDYPWGREQANKRKVECPLFPGERFVRRIVDRVRRRVHLRSTP